MSGQISGIRYAPVISIDDTTGCDMIKVRLHPEDDSKSIESIPEAFPLLPKMLHVKPKVGESVLILLSVTNDGNSQRYYIGPIISQDNRLYYDSYLCSDDFMNGAPVKQDVDPATIPETEGTLPNNDDVMLRGRKNADVLITNDDVRIRAGVKVMNENSWYDMWFNQHDPAYIKVKYHVNGLVKNGDFEEITQQCNSTATIVADKINLISNNSSEKTFDTTNKNDLISDDELKRVIKEAYKLPYGEKLVELLTVLINAFLKHTHPYPMIPPVTDERIEKLTEVKKVLLDDNNLLSDTVRFN